jgi:hypothetical protein
MLLRNRARWALAALLSMALLSAPAVWNRFPLLQYDTGGYLARWWPPRCSPRSASTSNASFYPPAILCPPRNSISIVSKQA